MKCKIYFASGQTIEFDTNQFDSFDTFVDQLSEIQSGNFMNIDGTKSIAKDYVQFMEKLDD